MLINDYLLLATTTCCSGPVGKCFVLYLQRVQKQSSRARKASASEAERSPSASRSQGRSSEGEDETKKESMEVDDVKSDKSNVSATSDEDDDEEFVPKASKKINQDRMKVAVKKDSRRTAVSKGSCSFMLQIFVGTLQV